MESGDGSNIPPAPPLPDLPVPFSLPQEILDDDDDPYKEKRRQKELQFRLVGALEQENCERVQELIDEGVDPNCIILLVKTPLLHVLEQPQVNTDILCKLLNAGADLNRLGSCRLKTAPIHVVAKSGDVNLAKILVEWLSVPKCDVNLQDRGGATPLQFAVQNQHKDMVNYLLEKGACIELTDIRGRSVFHRACETRNFEIAQILLDHGHDVNKPDSNRWTPLFHSVFFAHTNMVQFLIDKGASVNCMDKYGQLLLQMSGLDEHLTVSDYKLPVRVSLSTSFGYEAQEWCIPTQELQLLLFRLEGGQIGTASSLFDKYCTISAMLLNAGADPRLFAVRETAKRSKTLELLLSAGAQLDWKTLSAILETGSLSQEDEDWFQAQFRDQFTLKQQCRVAIRKAAAVSRDIKAAVDSLTLPPILKSYLNLQGTC